MIQAFTISFDFEGKTYLALASVKSDKNEDTAYSVRLYNTSLYRFFPNGILKYTSRGLESPAKLTHPLAEPLFNTIAKSVRAHLKLAQAHH
jgi:hypothetical protein